MRRQLRVLAALAGFVVLIVVLAFVGAIRRPESMHVAPTLVRFDARRLAEGTYQSTDVAASVVLDGYQYHDVALLFVRAKGHVLALWAHESRFGCRVVPIGNVPSLWTGAPKGAVFADPCGRSRFALDGRCLDGPCTRGLDAFKVVDNGGIIVADLTTLAPGR
jgi:hypothetical protein